MSEGIKAQIEEVYNNLLTAWNNRDADGMASLFKSQGEMIGFDGSHAMGREEILSHLTPVFESHPTAPYVSKVKEVRFLGSEVAILRSVAGMIPPGESTIKPEVNTHHTLVVQLENDKWEIDLFQNTPAQFHGRPELVEEMTKELEDLL